MSNHTPTRMYLGDSVYVEVEDGMAKLTTEDPDNPRHTIWMEPSVCEAFIAWLERMKQQAREEMEAENDG